MLNIYAQKQHMYLFYCLGGFFYEEINRGRSVLIKQDNFCDENETLSKSEIHLFIYWVHNQQFSDQLQGKKYSIIKNHKNNIHAAKNGDTNLEK